jgi:aminoglycoside phosphotransferase (APT) family kinase protein
MSETAAAPSAFVGTEPPPEHLRFNEDRLREWLAGRLPGFDGPIAVAKFKGGQSNPTYRIETTAGNYVLRRKPPGELRPGAHAIDREFRVLCALSPTGVPIPRPHFYCDDPSVIGSEFYLVDAVDGEVYWNAELPDQTPAYRGAYYADLIDRLAQVHTVDWRGVGLEGFGKSGGYTARQLERWYKTYCDTKAIEIPDMDWAAGALRERLPAQEPVSLVHGDYGNHNVIAAPDRPCVAAILDWEISTIGNPLVDLYHTLRPWMEPPQADSGRPTLVDKDLDALGIPTMPALAERYLAATGYAVPDLDFYCGFVMFRYAAMVQGVLHRYKIGSASNQRVSHDQGRVVAIAGAARAILEGGR